MEKLEHLHIVVGYAKWCSHYAEQCEISYDPVIPSGYLSKRIESGSWRDIDTSMFTAALLTLDKMWKQPKCPPTDGWVEKMWCTYTVEYYSAFKKKGTEPYMTTWMNLACMLVTLSCPTLCDPLDCSLPGSFVHGIFQARILKWVAISSHSGSSLPRDWTHVSCIASRFFTHWAIGEAPPIPC